MTLALGKLAKRDDARNLKLANYLNTDELPALPLHRAWSPRVSRWGMFANNRLGTCTVAAAAHAVQVWSSNNDRPVVISDADIVKAYKAISDYDGTPETDWGATALDLLKHWRTTGIGGHRILAFAEIDPRDHATLMHAINLFGGVYVGFQLPRSTETESIWADTRGKPGERGGHAVWLPNYAPSQRDCVTWGHRQVMTPEWVDRYADEVYAPLSEDWTGPDLVAPNGLRLHELLSDLKQVADGR